MKNKKWLIILIVAFPSMFWLILESSNLNSRKLPYYGGKLLNNIKPKDWGPPPPCNFHKINDPLPKIHGKISHSLPLWIFNLLASMKNYFQLFVLALLFRFVLKKFAIRFFQIRYFQIDSIRFLN